MNKRKLSKIEIAQLQAQECQAEDWGQILVQDPFDGSRFRNVSFSGTVELGVFSKKAALSGDWERPCGIYNCQIHNCSIGDNSYLANVASLANYTIADDVIIENVGTLKVVGSTSFGNGVEIDVLNEAGGRTLKIFDRLSAQMAYLLVFYRHHQQLIDKLNGMIDDYVKTRIASRGFIGPGVRILNATKITNVHLGPYARIDGALSLEEGTVQSSAEAPVVIGPGVIARRFIVLSGSKVDQSAIIEKCFVGQSVKMGKQYSAENSAFFCNSELFHGEGCSAFAGPYTVTHHKSTLLIAGFFSFYNAGSGSNQSNHMYKLGPVHQGILERGSKTGSFSYLSWENRVGAFSNVIGKHYANFNTTDLPFSLIRESGGKTICVPGWNLSTVGLKRDGMKWPARDGRKGPKLDLIHFQVLSPYVVGKILRGIEKLKQLSTKLSEGQEHVNFNGVLIHKKAVQTSCDNYEMAIRIFVGDCLLRKLAGLKGASAIKNVQAALADNVSGELVPWVDVNGLMMPEPAIVAFVNNVVGGKVKDVRAFQDQLSDIHAKYEHEEWSWCAKLIETRNQKPIRTLTADALKLIIEDWKTAARKLNTMILEDAQKEFNPESKLSYGIDGDAVVRDADFEAVRGTYDKNSFVRGVKEDSDMIESRANAAIEFLEHLV